VVTWFWLQWLRLRPEVRHALGVDETGAPEAFIPELEAEEGEPGSQVAERPDGERE
jgi:hypothetical protein